MSGEPKLKFESPEEFAEICQYLSARMHYLNRVAMGESGFVWITADMLARLGRSFAESHGDDDVRTTFGDGWTAGTVARADRPAALMARLYPDR